jgi:hypothetical protein
MTLRITMILFLAAAFVFTGACSTEHNESDSHQAEAQAGPAPAPAHQPPGGPTASGTVVETINAANYTYVRVETPDGEIWAAANRFDVAVGDSVIVPLEMPMENFHSETLDRTFEVVYFTSMILKEGETGGSTMPAGHPPVAAESVSAHGKNSVTEMVQPAKGGVTVSRIWTESKDLAGTEITVRGKVVKFNGGILGTNWIHLQDGTGSAADGTHDITVTTSGTAAVGDVVTAKGVLVTDKDFGAGYTYEVLLENAELIAD